MQEKAKAAYSDALCLGLLAPLALLYELERSSARAQDLLAVHAQGGVEEGVVLRNGVQVGPQDLKLVLLRLVNVHLRVRGKMGSRTGSKIGIGEALG